VRRATTPLLVLAFAAVIGFLVIPLAAVFVAAGPGALVDALGRDVVRDALLVSLKTNVIAQCIVLLVGTPAAYLIARGVPFRRIVVGVIELPLVLPPLVAGVGLLYTFGRAGILGDAVEFLGLRIALTQVAVVFAIVFVSSPFYVRWAINAFEGIDRHVVDAARTLGASPGRVFRTIELPLAAPGLVAGATLAAARGLGEFGATLVFAGSLQGTTQTLPLAIYSEYDTNPATALAIGCVLILVSAIILIGSKLGPRWRP
jgi:molybdate transport system permease protein